MLGGRKQRQFDFLATFFLICCLAAGCSHQPGPADEKIYQQAVLDLRRGNLVAAQSAAEKGAAAWSHQPDSEEYWNYRTLRAEILTNQGRSKEALDLLDAEPPQSLAAAQCRFRMVRVRALLRLGRLKEAKTELDAAEVLAAQTNQASIRPEIAVLRGTLFLGTRQTVDAEDAYRTGLKEAEDLKDLYWQAVILNNLGYLRVQQMQWDQAIPLFTRAQENFEKMDAKLFAAVTLSNIGLCEWQLGDFDAASASLLKVVEVEKREGAKPYVVSGLGQIGNFYNSLEQYDQAIPYLQDALALALEIGATPDAALWAGNLASAYTQLQNWDQAEKFNNQAQKLKEQLKGSQTNTNLNAAYIALGRKQFADAETWFKKVITDPNPDIGVWEAHAGLGNLYRQAGDKKKSYEQYAAAIDVIETSTSELNRSDYKISFLSRLIRFYQEYVDALISDGNADRALEIAESSRARVLAEKFGHQGIPEKTLSAESYSRAARLTGTTFMSYWLAPKHSFLWLITPEKRKLFVLPGRTEIEALVRSYQTFIDASRDPLDSIPPAAARLYDVLIAPAKADVPKGANVVIVPDGALHNLNFETLPVPGDKPYYWIEDVTLAIAPSLAIDIARPVTVPALKSVLVIGNPDAEGTDFQSLPYAGTEVRNVQKRLGALQQTVYEGSRAEPSAYKASDPGNYSVIHFAAHASAKPESPLESAIILSKNDSDSFKLYARDVMSVPIHAELVTISSCHSAGAHIYSGEGLVGFTWAFLQAGAKNVIAGLWDVNDNSTAQLMDRLYAGLGAGKSPAAALREAKLSLIHSQGNLRKPYYWGPFQVYVGGRSR